jgi:hypothetical protein
VNAQSEKDKGEGSRFKFARRFSGGAQSELLDRIYRIILAETLLQTDFEKTKSAIAAEQWQWPFHRLRKLAGSFPRPIDRQTIATNCVSVIK